ncbi:MAG: SDR family oxidoreductase [Roseateles sp.]|uniref:SDR family oxidoreductase n=1 Tax=Roseateles sp. TaxID=1971397 RepID=UPI0039EA954B
MNSPLAGKRALVTAGASGIGLVIAQRLIAAGARCMVCDVDESALRGCAAVLGDERLALRADVSNEQDVDALFAEVGPRLGGLDILVNNAGISGPTAPLEELSLADWRRTIAVNLDGHFLCTRRAIPLLRAAGGGSIVNMSSIGGRLGYPKRSSYAAAKWGIVGLTKTLSIELGPDNIRVNVIQPGIVEGPRVERVMREKAEAAGLSFEELQRRALQRVSLRRGVTADDIAALVEFLASDAGRNISGQAIPVDGDQTSLG